MSTIARTTTCATRLRGTSSTSRGGVCKGLLGRTLGREMSRPYAFALATPGARDVAPVPARGCWGGPWGARCRALTRLRWRRPAREMSRPYLQEVVGADLGVRDVAPLRVCVGDARRARCRA